MTAGMWLQVGYKWPEMVGRYTFPIIGIDATMVTRQGRVFIFAYEA